MVATQKARSKHSPKCSIRSKRNKVRPADLAISFRATRKFVEPSGIDPWARSPYGWFRGLTSRKKGKAGEMIIEDWLQSREFSVKKARSTGADRTINLDQVEIKCSTLWEAGTYKFQQLRPQDYSHVILMGVSPDRLHVWCVPKEVVFSHSERQHGGKRGTGTDWLTVDPQNVPAWLAPYGGSPERGLSCIRAALGSMRAAKAPMCASRRRSRTVKVRARKSS